jgi:hypothetical protein
MELQRFVNSQRVTRIVGMVAAYVERMRLTNPTYYFAAEFAEVGG